MRFFFAGTDALTVLTEINPSLAWLPLLADMKVFQENDGALAAWVERNFGAIEAVREVVENLRFFNAETARVLRYRLDAHHNSLDPLLTKCWQLIIRHIENEQNGRVQNEWFELAPRLRQGDLSTDVLVRIVHLLTPRLFIGKRYGWYDEGVRKVEKPGDVMSIKYSVDDSVGEQEFFAAWPKAASPEAEDFLVGALTNSLSATLADAVEVGVEGPFGLSLTDIDVPSVAAHEQNAFREGFLPIVRILAELWSRLIRKHQEKALQALDIWKRSSFRLVHRLALFAAADPKVPSDLAAGILLAVPQAELFFTNSQVEVHRLVRLRWSEFSQEDRELLERRIVEGPPTEWFKDGIDLSEPMDRHRFALLLDLERSNVPLGADAAGLLADIRRRHPKWADAEPEKAGFAIWQDEDTPQKNRQENLKLVPSEQLIQAAKKAASEATFLDGDAWLGLCNDDPLIAFAGIEDAPNEDRWLEWAWRPLFWASAKIADVGVLNRMARLVVQWPELAPFTEAAHGAAFWMDQVSEKLEPGVLWALWDMIEKRAPRRQEVPDKDIFTSALNDPAGNLASVLLKRTPVRKGQDEMDAALRDRYTRLLEPNDYFALLARVRFSAAIAFLFERAPSWTTSHILPSYQWTSSDALAMWSARKYTNHIGSAKLFELIKQPFIELFSRRDVPAEDIRTFSGWLAVILIVNQAGKAHYPLATTEVRSILRTSANATLWSFAHRLAIEMERATSAEKISAWRTIVRPVFERTWPLDAELQTPRATGKLVQLLLATGEAFGEAAPIIIPFIRPEEARSHSSVYSISETKPDLYRVAPAQMLNLLGAVAGDAPHRSLYGMEKALQKLQEAAPELAGMKAFQKLAMQAMSLS
ncbi:hypothetical protein [Bradyrhizobium elkanii]|nr:hypothetical protein [Bradyrhizobium elkanii]